MKITYRNIYGDMIIKLPKEDIKKESVNLFGNNIDCSVYSISFYPSLKCFVCEDKEIENKYNNDIKLINKLCEKWNKHLLKC